MVHKPGAFSVQPDPLIWPIKAPHTDHTRHLLLIKMLFLALSLWLAAVSGKGVLHLADPPTEVEFGYCGKRETGDIRNIDGALSTTRYIS